MECEKKDEAEWNAITSMALAELRPRDKARVFIGVLREQESHYRRCKQVGYA
jgi:hypothetical protein